MTIWPNNAILRNHARKEEDKRFYNFEQQVTTFLFQVNGKQKWAIFRIYTINQTINILYYNKF